MKSDSKAGWFVLAFGAGGFLLAVAMGYPLERCLISGALGLAVGLGLMVALRWRP